MSTYSSPPPSPAESFRSGTSSPPPFDVLAGSQRAEDYPRSRGLSHRLRQVGTAIGILRGVSLSGSEERGEELTMGRLSRAPSSVGSIASSAVVDGTDEATDPFTDHSHIATASNTRPSLRDRFRQIGSALSMMRGMSTASSDERPTQFGPAAADQADMRLGIGRSMRAYNLFEEIRVDYQRSVIGLAEESRERELTLMACHRRSAKKCLELARTNGGLYIKVFECGFQQY